MDEGSLTASAEAEEAVFVERPIVSDLREEWYRATFTDVVIVCESGEKTVRTHRIVLAAISDLFKRALCDHQQIEDDAVVVIVPDIKAELLESFLKRAYFGGFEEILMSPDLDFLGFTDKMLGSSEAEVKVEASDHGLFEQDSMEADAVHPRPIEVTLQMLSSVEDRENQILLERSENPVALSRRMRNSEGKSIVWSFFNLSSQGKSATCKECKKVLKIKPGCSSALSRHMRMFHDEILREGREWSEHNESEADSNRENIEYANEDGDFGGQEVNSDSNSSRRSAVWDFFTACKNQRAKCNECDKTFTNATGTTTTLARHLKSEHPDSYEQVEKKTRARKEAEQKKEEELKKSTVVSVSSVDAKSSLVWKHFRQESLGRISCLHCGALFKTLAGSTSSALRHLKKMHPEKTEGDDDEEAEEEEENDDSIWNFFFETDSDATCKQCDESVPLGDGYVHLREHLKTAHDQSVASGTGRASASAVLRRVKFTVPDGAARQRAVVWNYFDKTNDRQTHTCKACLKVFKGPKKNNYSAMVRHLRLTHSRLHRQFLRDCGHSEEKIEEILLTKKRGRKKLVDDDDVSARTCPDCGQVYSRRKGMMVHYAAVHSGSKPFVCDECGVSFARKESLKRHTHSDVRPFLCSVCGKTFARRHIRDIHERAHSGDKRYACSFCSKRFTTNQKKQIHERTHTGEKPFQCNMCPKRFAQRHQLDTHTRIHTGDKPYQCLNCLLFFRHLSTRAKHNCPGRSATSATQQVIEQSIYDTQESTEYIFEEVKSDTTLQG